MIDLVQWVGLSLALYFGHKSACLTRHQTPLQVRLLIAASLLAPALVLAISLRWQTALWLFNFTGFLNGQVSYLPTWAEAMSAWATAGTNYLVFTLIRRIQKLRDKIDEV